MPNFDFDGKRIEDDRERDEHGRATDHAPAGWMDQPERAQTAQETEGKPLEDLGEGLSPVARVMSGLTKPKPPEGHTRMPMPRWANTRDVEIVREFLRKRSEDAEKWLEDMHAHSMNPDAIDRAEARAMDCAQAIGAFDRIVEMP